MIKFLQNGIKASDMKGLQKAGYYFADDGIHIRIFAKTYAFFSDEIQKAFKIRNDSDIMTDYFDHDTFMIGPDNSYYNAVKIVMAKKEIFRCKKSIAKIRKQLIECKMCSSSDRYINHLTEFLHTDVNNLKKYEPIVKELSI